MRKGSLEKLLPNNWQKFFRKLKKDKTEVFFDDDSLCRRYGNKTYDYLLFIKIKKIYSDRVQFVGATYEDPTAIVRYSDIYGLNLDFNGKEKIKKARVKCHYFKVHTKFVYGPDL